MVDDDSSLACVFVFQRAFGIIFADIACAVASTKDVETLGEYTLVYIEKFFSALIVLYSLYDSLCYRIFYIIER